MCKPSSDQADQFISMLVLDWSNYSKEWELLSIFSVIKICKYSTEEAALAPIINNW
jgi:hypothetical protein